MRHKDFAVFILTHGRPDRVETYKTLQRIGYTGRTYIIIDNEDKTAQRYYDRFGDRVIMFDKAAIAETFDEGDNFEDRRAVIYARNASFEIARQLGITYFLQLDDDYTMIKFRINDSLQYPDGRFIVKSQIDGVLDAYLDYYCSISAKSIAMAQGGDFAGGVKGEASFKTKRKCMNSFFCSTDRPFRFVGRINEDVNTYTWFQSLGHLFLTVPFMTIDQPATQSNSGGMTELYLDNGTYIKSFYTVMYAPSCTHVSLMQARHKRLHHQIAWENAVPCIVPEQCRKGEPRRVTQ